MHVKSIKRVVIERELYTSAKVQLFLDLLLTTYSTRADSVLDTTEIENLQ